MGILGEVREGETHKFAILGVETKKRDVLRRWQQTGRTSAEVSDAVRAELLRRYGGTYIDLDAITLRPLPTTMNWLGRIDSKLVTAAVSRFAPGHPLLQVRPRDTCFVGQ